MSASFKNLRFLDEPALRPLAAACLLAAVGFGSTACSQRSPSAIAAGVAAPVPAQAESAVAPQPQPAAGSDPSVPSAGEVFGRKVNNELSDPPPTF